MKKKKPMCTATEQLMIIEKPHSAQDISDKNWLSKTSLVSFTLHCLYWTIVNKKSCDDCVFTTLSITLILRKTCACQIHSWEKQFTI